MTNPKRNGRPPLSSDKLRGAVIRMRCTLSEVEKFTMLGGATWLRKTLKRARVVAPDKA